MASCTASACSRPAISARSVSAMSMLAVTPPPVMMLPSRTTRAASGLAPKARSASRHAKWQAARRPVTSPAAASSIEPVHTEVA